MVLELRSEGVPGLLLLVHIVVLEDLGGREEVQDLLVRVAENELAASIVEVELLREHLRPCPVD